jgi:hypothetical protein
MCADNEGIPRQRLMPLADVAKVLTGINPIGSCHPK